MKKEKRLSGYWIFIIILGAIVLVCNILSRFRVICDFYVDHVFYIWSNTFGRLTGLLPFSVGFAVIPVGIVLLIVAVILSILLIFLHKKTKYKKFTIKYLKVILAIVLSVGLLMTLNCSALYRCSKIKLEGKEDKDYTVDNLISIYNFMVEECNNYSGEVERNSDGDAVYDGNLNTAISDAIKKMAKKDKRYRGYTGTMKYFTFPHIMDDMGIIGEYTPYTMESNYSPYLNDLSKASTACHEISHTKGYIYEDEANFMEFRILTESENDFLIYSGYLDMLGYIRYAIYETTNNPEVLCEMAGLNAPYDENSYTFKAIKELEEYKASATEKLVSKVSDEVTDTAYEYYENEPNYSEVVLLLLKYYDGILY